MERHHLQVIQTKQAQGPCCQAYLESQPSSWELSLKILILEIKLRNYLSFITN